MYRQLTLMALASVLAGCHTAARYAGDENSPYYVVPAGSRVVLNQALTVPPEEAGVFIQNGAPRPRAQVSFYDPYCRLELKTVRGTPRTVAPDDMIVRRSMQQTLQTYTRIPGEQYALLLLAAEPDDRDDGNSTLQTFATRMDLDSQKQPDVDRLICAMVGYRGEARHVTIAEMRRTLGDIATLRFPDRAR